MKKFPKLGNQKGAALIIALLIVTVAGITILGVGRTIVQSTFSTNRYADAVVAEQAAWAGIEDGLARLKTTMNNNVAPPAYNTINSYFPNFNENYQMVMRRNLSELIGGKDQIAGVATGSDPYVGLDYEQPLTEPSPCTAGNCEANKWDLSDLYYDLRVSSSDDAIQQSTNLKVVNLDNSDAPIIDRGYYNPSRAEQNAKGLGAVYRIHDLTNYTGINSGNPSHQSILLRYNSTGLSVGGSIRIDFFAYYGDQNSAGTTTVSGDGDMDGTIEVGETITLNRYLYCFNPRVNGSWGIVDADNPAITYRSSGNYFKSSFMIGGGVTNGFVRAYVPSPCGSSLDTVMPAVKGYLVIKFTFNGTTSGNLYYGLRHSNFAAPYPNSYIGTGVSKITSTGIFNNIRKTIEIAGVKDLFLDTSFAEDDLTNRIRCKSSSGTTETDLRNCRIKIYRDTKY